MARTGVLGRAKQDLVVLGTEDQFDTLFQQNFGVLTHVSGHLAADAESENNIDGQDNKIDKEHDIESGKKLLVRVGIADENFDHNDDPENDGEHQSPAENHIGRRQGKILMFQNVIPKSHPSHEIF